MPCYHDISNEDVLQALSFAEDRSSRLNINPEEENIIVFTLSFDHERYAIVQFCITPIRLDKIHHILFKVEATYTPSDNTISINEVITPAQLIYNRYINVIWLKLDENILKCQLNELAAQGHSVSDDEVDSGGIVCAVGEPGRNTKIAFNQKRSRNHPHEVAESLTKIIMENTGKQEPVGPGQEANYDFTIVQSLNPKDIASYDWNRIQHALSETEFYYKKEGNKKKEWTVWYFRCCLQMVLEKTYYQQQYLNHKSRTFKGAKVANLIINKLLKSDGIAAVGVYNALAVSGLKFSKASELKYEDTEYVTDWVANDLHNQIQTPIRSTLIPFPGFWLCALCQTVS
ncbi:hypothetical protein GGI35DRAFT_126629 [Trichoderma velutinum]